MLVSCGDSTLQAVQTITHMLPTLTLVYQLPRNRTMYGSSAAASMAAEAGLPGLPAAASFWTSPTDLLVSTGDVTWTVPRPLPLASGWPANTMAPSRMNFSALLSATSLSESKLSCQPVDR